MTSLRLPTEDGGQADHVVTSTGGLPAPRGAATNRVAFAAAHVVVDPLGDNTPGQPPTIDWESTLGFRRHLYSYGFGLAEAMDTAQRGMGLDWPTAEELIRRSAKEAEAAGARIAAGAGTDQLPVGPTDLETVRRAYVEQVAFVEDAGAQPIVMASRHLAAAARGTDDYWFVYDSVLSQVSSPVILHWLGTAFDPALAGYWGSDDVASATDAFVDLVTAHADRVDGVKVSLLDADHEKALRARLPEGVRLYTGDDFNYPELIRGDGQHHSDALLGIFAAIAPAASEALHALDRGDHTAYETAFAPTLPLARQVFAAPTYYYKTGVAFIAWLSGFQPGFTMVGGLQSARSITHLAEVFRLVDAANLLPDPDLAAHRMRLLLETAGVTS
ncbi:hypothetical protein JNB_10984 [Janibacter sp. HTCC2649]|uniref:dihydrodipicolinate synthase family protein n=1 Tax=Janibacter sp. HTCC2649 TaxID=313589 RepID=UPI0000670BA3|nr:dihydrodipicolinate synthase family protein [Janibacter sp. HTCC2649]EAQ00694.1 hypothetical protein JNB_10984 [Janibacter sp. HTCC2649]